MKKMKVSLLDQLQKHVEVHWIAVVSFSMAASDVKNCSQACLEYQMVEALLYEK